MWRATGSLVCVPLRPSLPFLWEFRRLAFGCHDRPGQLLYSKGPVSGYRSCSTVRLRTTYAAHARYRVSHARTAARYWNGRTRW